MVDGRCVVDVFHGESLPPARRGQPAELLSRSCSAGRPARPPVRPSSPLPDPVRRRRQAGHRRKVVRQGDAAPMPGGMGMGKSGGFLVVLAEWLLFPRLLVGVVAFELDVSAAGARARANRRGSAAPQAQEDSASLRRPPAPCAEWMDSRPPPRGAGPSARHPKRAGSPHSGRKDARGTGATRAARRERGRRRKEKKKSHAEADGKGGRGSGREAGGKAGNSRRTRGGGQNRARP